MPRTPRNPGSGKPPSNAPASGAGWGGPARGAGNGNSRSVITPENTADLAALHGTPEAEAKRARRIATAEELKLNLTTIALYGEIETNRMNAAVHLLNRIEGMPTQRLNANIRRTAADFTDDELTAIASGGGGSEGVAETPSGSN